MVICYKCWIFFHGCLTYFNFVSFNTIFSSPKSSRNCSFSPKKKKKDVQLAQNFLLELMSTMTSYALMRPVGYEANFPLKWLLKVSSPLLDGLLKASLIDGLLCQGPLCVHVSLCVSEHPVTPLLCSVQVLHGSVSDGHPVSPPFQIH